MGLGESLVFYVLIGAGVAVASATVAGSTPSGLRALRLVTALLFWPLHLPLLLARREAVTSPPGAAAVDDDMAAAIQQVERELASALTSLDGWAEEVLARERLQVGELCAAWTAQAQRIREIDRLLDADRGEGEQDPADNERCQRSAAARRGNMARLSQLRRQAHDDLMGSLAWVRELVSMIHLARFTGAPASRAGELVAQIAAAVEGLSEVSRWHDPLPSPQVATP